MEIGEAYRTWGEDAKLLAAIGRELFTQPTKVLVRLPQALAERAVAAWERDGYEGPLPPEDVSQKTVRHRAGTVGLIGLTIQERGTVEGDEVLVEIDAWYVGSAFDAAEDAGLLDGLRPPAH